MNADTNVLAGIEPSFSLQSDFCGETGRAPNSDQTSCALCAAVINHNACTICCIVCSRPVHLSCLITRCKQLGGAAFKNSLEWLQGFIQNTSLCYVCQFCSLSSKNGKPHITSTRKSPSGGFPIQIIELQNKVTGIHQ